jgi:hypothetical protein
MKYTIPRLILLLVARASLNNANEALLENAIEDDTQFWSRFLLGDGLSVPTRSPMQPVPSPIVPPIDCDVNVALECNSSDGTKCDELPLVDKVCSDGSDISMLQFRLNAGRQCAMSENSQDSFCLDCLNVTTSVSFMVLCKNAETGEDLLVAPAAVQQGEIFTVTPNATSGILPNNIDCIYIDEESKKIQQNIINTSGNIPLNLNEKFGAFTLLSCDLGAPPGGSSVKTCLDTLSFMIDIANVGPVELEIEQLDFTLSDGTTTSFLGDIDNPILSPSNSLALEILLLVDLCSEIEICAAIDINALPTNGNRNTCQDDDAYCVLTLPIPMNPSPPTPVKSPVSTPVNLPVPLTKPVPTPITLPVPAPITLPVPTPFTLPIPLPLPVPVSAPVQPPSTPPVPISLPVPILPVSPPVPSIPTAPVRAPKSKTSMSKIPSSPGNVGPSTPIACPTGKGSCGSMSPGSKLSQKRLIARK